jgi:hypothetical protein
MRTFLGPTIAAAALAIAPTAHADEETPPPRGEQRTLDIAGTLLAGRVQSIDNIALQAAIRAHASRAWSFGALGMYGGTLGAQLWRAAGEAAFHPLSLRWVDAYVAAEAGFAFSQLGDESRYQDGTLIRTETDRRLRVGPSAGFGVGADVLPVRFFSVGVEARALGIIFDHGPDPQTPSGPTTALFVGVGGALRLPVLD